MVHKYLNQGLEPGPLSNQDWDSFWAVLSAVGSEIDELRRDPTELNNMFRFKFDKSCRHPPTHWPRLYSVHPTLQNCAVFFKQKFSVVALKSGGKVQHTLPRSPGQWQHIIGTVLDYRNRECGPHEEGYELNTQNVEAHVKSLHQHPFNPPGLRSL